jgi:hypothetical protein
VQNPFKPTAGAAPPDLSADSFSRITPHRMASSPVPAVPLALKSPYCDRDTCSSQWFIMKI